MPVSVISGTGAFAAGTTVTAILNATQFTVSTAPTTALSGGSTIIFGQGPPPPGCANFQGSDVWYQTTVGANGHLEVNFQQQTLFDPGVAVYTGTCGNLTLQACNDDGGFNLQPYIFLTTLPPGSTVFIRVWDYGGNNFGNMGLCLTDPCPSGAAANDEPCGATFVPMTPNPCTNWTNTSNTCAGGSLGVPTPACGNYSGGDVWMSTTVGSNGHLGINVQSSSIFDMACALYTGPCNSLTEVACDDFSGPGAMPFIYTNSLAPGSTVYIRLWSPFAAQTGNFDVCFSDPCPGGTVIPPMYDDPPCPAPASAALFLPFTNGPCATFTTYSSLCANTGLSNSPLPLGTQNPVGCSGPFYPPAAFTSANWDVWAAFIVPTLPVTGFIDFNTVAGTIWDLDFAIYTITGGYANNCSNPAAYTMRMCSDLDGVGFMPYLHLPYGGGNPVQPGDTIMLRMWDYFGSEPGTWGMCINNPCPGGTVPPPAYDDPPCPGSAVLLPIQGGPCIGGQAGDNICAGTTIDPSQAGLCAFPNGSQDIWYVIQMPAGGSGQLDFNFTGTGTLGDPGMAVYSGSPVSCGGPGLTLLACDDDAGPGLNPYISLTNPVAPGQYLYIRIWGYNNSRGNFTGFCVNDPCPQQPVNDLRCNATPMVVGSTCNFITGSIVCAGTNNTGVPSPGCGNYNGRDVWYSFTAPASGAVVIDSREGTLDNIDLAVYHSSSGNDCNAGFVLDACDDNTGVGNMPFLSLTSLTPGRTYWIRVWENGGNQDGDFDLCIFNPCPSGPPPNDAVCNAQLLSLNNITAGFNNCATSDAGITAPGCWINQAPYNTPAFMNTVWFKITGDTTYTIVVNPNTLTRPQVSIYKPTIGTNCASLVAPIKLAGVDICDAGNFAGCKPTPYSSVISVDGGLVSSYTPGFQATDTLYIAVEGVNGLNGSFDIAAYNSVISGLPPLAVQDCRRAVPICGNPTFVSNPGYTNSGNICDLTSNFDYNVYASAAGATSAGTTITVGSTAGLSVGMRVTVSAGVGAFAAGTRVVTIPTATTFTVSTAPTTALSGGASVVLGTITPAYQSAATASSAGTTVTVGSTAGLYAGMYVSVIAGTGVFAANTVVTSITNATQFVVSPAPTTALSGATVLGLRYPQDSRFPEVNSAWYFFSTDGNAGTLIFDITGNSTTNYDWVLWDITGSSVSGQNTAGDVTTCNLITNIGTTGAGTTNTGRPIRANVYNSTTPTGISASYTTDPAFSAPVAIPAAVQTYMLCVMNNEGNNSGFTLNMQNTPINYTASSIVWNDGSASTNWFDPGNWGGCVAPNCQTHASVVAAPDQPVISANATVNNLTISAGATLTLAPGVTLSICGNLQNNGSFIASPSSSVRFVGTNATGAAGQTISGNFIGANKFPNLIIDKPVIYTAAATAPSAATVINVPNTTGLNVGNAVFVTAGTGAFRMGTTIVSVPGVYASAAGAKSLNYATYTSAAGATGASTTITVGTTVGLYPGMVVTVTAGIGAFAPRTYITNIINGTQFSVSAAPTTALAGGASVVTANGSMIGVSTTAGLLPGQLVTVSAGTGSFPAGTTTTAVLSASSGGGSSAGTTITVASTAGMYPGMMVSVTAGTGAFAAGTVITSITNGTTMVVSAAPSTGLVGATVLAAGFGTSSPPSVALGAGAVVSGGPVFGVSIAPAVTIGTGATIKAASGVVTLNTNADIGGNLTMASNTSHLNATGRYIKLARNFTNASGNATFNPTGSNLEFNGTGVQSFANSTGSNGWFDNATGYFVLNNVIINQTDPYNDYVDLAGSTGTDNNMRVNANLTLTSGRIFTNQWEVYNRNPFPTAVVTNPLCNPGVSGTINPVCNNSYIEGNHTRNVRRTGTNENYLFAVGQGGYSEFAYVKRLASSGGASTDTLRLRAVFNNWPVIPPVNGPVGIDCGGAADWSTKPVYDHGYWTIDSLTAIGTGGSVIGNYDLNLKPNDAVVGNVDGAAVFWSVMKRTPSGTGTWTVNGNCATPPSTMYDVYRTSMFKFSDFAVTQSGSVLPIELLFFNAEQTDDGVLCSWVTSTEINNDYFVVERSYDGKQYMELGRVKGAGNSSTTLNYSFLDRTVCQGLSYYRLKQVDYDGKTTYYNDRVVAVDCKSRNPIVLRPNPAQTEIFSEFQMSSDATVKLVVVDIMGQEVQSEAHDVLKGENLVKTEISKLAPGVYYMKIYKAGFEEPSFIEKFMKY
jgi:hypothetical protein